MCEARETDGGKTKKGQCGEEEWEHRGEVKLVTVQYIWLLFLVVLLYPPGAEGLYVSAERECVCMSVCAHARRMMTEWDNVVIHMLSSGAGSFPT